MPPPPARGSLVGTGPVQVASYSAGALGNMLNNAQSGTTTLTGEPRCGMTVHTVRYHSIGSQQEASEATAAIYQPTGSDPSCQGARPVLLYAHATSFDQSFDMGKVAAWAESRMVAGMYAAQGYLVVAPNYAGYTGSSLNYHPYLDANQQAEDMVDALRAARHVFAMIGFTDSGKLALAGYSQGGHVALATEYAMHSKYASEFKVNAVAAMSGPYALLQMGDNIFGGSPTMGATGFLPLLTTAAQKAGAAIYTSPNEMYEPAFASGIESLLPVTGGLDALVAANKLPATNLFARDSQPQAGSGFGDGNLVKSSYRSAWLSDAQVNPCTSLSVCTPGNPLRKWLLKNDLRPRQPHVPVMLCGGEADPTVPWANALAAQSAFSAGGLLAQDLILLNVDDVPGLGSDYKNARSGFAAAKLALRLDAIAHGDSPSAAVAANYHAGLVPPFCMMAARDFLAGRIVN